MNPSEMTSRLLKPRFTLGAMLGGIALLAATLAFTMPMIRWIIDGMMDEPTRSKGLLAIGIKAGLIVLNSQLIYGFYVIPLIQLGRVRLARGRRR